MARAEDMHEFQVLLTGENTAVARFRTFTEAERYAERKRRQGFHPTLIAIGPPEEDEEPTDE